MTKGEQVRLAAWRLKVLQQAADAQYVARVCRRFGISRKSFYKWKRRHAEHGDASLGDRPRTARESRPASPWRPLATAVDAATPNCCLPASQGISTNRRQRQSATRTVSGAVKPLRENRLRELRMTRIMQLARGSSLRRFGRFQAFACRSRSATYTTLGRNRCNLGTSRPSDSPLVVENRGRSTSHGQVSPNWTRSSRSTGCSVRRFCPTFATSTGHTLSRQTSCSTSSLI